jgi:hypothetical protein
VKGVAGKENHDTRNTVGPDQNQASGLAAMSEAEKQEKAKAELSDLLRQIDQTKVQADEAQALINRPSNRARRTTEALAESSARKLSGPAGG